MLLLQKSVVEGSLAVLLQSAYYQDMAENGPEETKEFYHDLLEFLTPIAKTYPSEMGRVSISNGLQIFGGYGFCTDFPLEQYYRDVRIMALYEGTTGIQSLDLLGRKTTMKNGQALQFLTKEVLKTVEAAQTYDELKPYADQLQAKMTEAGEIIMHLLKFAMSGEHERFIMDATMYMEYMSTLVIGWQWLKMATVAKEALVTGNKVQKDEFYESKVHCMKFYFKYEMPKTNGLKETLLHTDVLTLLEENKAIFA
jgi:butyryl-CoA dehydrogenase